MSFQLGTNASRTAQTTRASVHCTRDGGFSADGFCHQEQSDPGSSHVLGPMPDASARPWIRLPHGRATHRSFPQVDGSDRAIDGHRGPHADGGSSDGDPLMEPCGLRLLCFSDRDARSRALPIVEASPFPSLEPPHRRCAAPSELVDRDRSKLGELRTASRADCEMMPAIARRVASTATLL